MQGLKIWKKNFGQRSASTVAAVCLQNAFSPTAREPLVGSGIAAQISNRHDPRNILGTIHFFDTSSSRGSRGKNVKSRFYTREMGGSCYMAPGGVATHLDGWVWFSFDPKDQ